MKAALTILGLWGFSGLICLPAVIGGPATSVALTFLCLLVVFSAYLYSARFASLVDLLWARARKL